MAPRRIEKARAGVTRGVRLRGDELLDLFFDLSRGGEAAQGLFREDQVVRHGHLEDAAAAPDQLGLDPELLFELRRQTGGAGVVVSARAVLDSNVGWHAHLLSRPIIDAREGPLDAFFPGGVPIRLTEVTLFERGMNRKRSLLRGYKVRQGDQTGQNLARKNFPLDFSRASEYNRDCSTAL